VDISPNASIGVTVLVWDGHDDVIRDYHCGYCEADTFDFDFEELIGTDYSALSAIVGLQLRLSPWLTVGGSVESPVRFTLEGSATRYRANYTEYLWFKEKLRLPFSFVGGGAVRLGALTVAGDVRYTDWRQIDYEGILREEGGFEYRATTEVHAGAEYLLPFYPLQVRAGYYTEPLAYKAGSVEEDRDFYTLGAGLLVEDVLALDVALLIGRLKWLQDYEGREIYRDESFSRMFLSAAYRF